MINEFKEFIKRGNVIDLAVGVVMGNAFGKIVTSIVSDILMPIIGVILGGINFTGLYFEIGDSVIKYGNFIQNVIDFLIIAVCIFFMIQVINKLTRKEKHKEEEKEEQPKAEPSEEAKLLMEIRDLLTSEKNVDKSNVKKEKK